MFVGASSQKEAPSGNQIQHTFGGVKVTSTCSEKMHFRKFCLDYQRVLGRTPRSVGG